MYVCAQCTSHVSFVDCNQAICVWCMWKVRFIRYVCGTSLASFRRFDQAIHLKCGARLTKRYKGFEMFMYLFVFVCCVCWMWRVIDVLYVFWCCLWSVEFSKGFLVKRGHVVKNWKERWFILQDNILFYFKKKPSAVCNLTTPHHIHHTQHTAPVPHIPHLLNTTQPTHTTYPPHRFIIAQKSLPLGAVPLGFCTVDASDLISTYCYCYCCVILLFLLLLLMIMKMMIVLIRIGIRKRNHNGTSIVSITIIKSADACLFCRLHAVVVLVVINRCWLRS